MVKIALIGYGYWGPNLLRNFYEVKNCDVIWCADINEKALVKVSRRYPQIKLTTDYKDLLKDSSVEAVVIATPVFTHYSLAREFLLSGRDVFVEKPMTASLSQAKKLVEIASEKRRILMVDHTFIYTPAIQKMKEIIDNRKIGKLLYIDSVRISLGLFQKDVNVVFDLACHDFSIVDFLFGYFPTCISASGMSHFGSPQENLAYVSAYYDEGFIFHTHVSWLSPVKVRTMILSGSKKMVIYDDLLPSEKIKIYDKGVIIEKDPKQIFQARFGYRSGDVLSPQLEVREALSNASRHFIECVLTRKKPLSDVEAGMRVVYLLERATKSLRKGGRRLELKKI